MKVIICGAGEVGASIAEYLAEEDNNVTIIDISASLIAEINDTLNVSGIVGYASHPSVLEKAGAHDADIIIAATHLDEVNMVACQVAHTLFNVPKKIARVREQSYLDPLWSNLFSRDHMPIDKIISPEVEVARAISNRLRVPGAFNVIPLADEKMQLVSVICHDDCPLLNVPLKHFSNLFPDLTFNVVNIIRGQENIIPRKGNEEIQSGDEVYFLTSTEHLRRTMAAFGHEEAEARRVLIAGAGNIGLLVAQMIEKDHPEIKAYLMESNAERAKYASEQLDNTIVLQGDSLDRKILEEANVSMCEAVIAVTNHDESNVLISLLAKEYGCERSITLLNNAAYMPLVSSLGIDAIVSPRAITVSTILQQVRRGRVRSVHSLRGDFAEIIELEALDTAQAVNHSIRELNLPKNVLIGAIVRGADIIVPQGNTVIKAQDRIIILSAHEQIRKVEQIFAVRPEYF